MNRSWLPVSGGMPANPEAVHAMLAQGFRGRVAACPLEAAARKTLDLALRGCAAYVPLPLSVFALSP